MERDTECRELLYHLRAGSDSLLIRDVLGLEGTTDDVRDWIIQTAQSPAFVEELIRDHPVDLVPAIETLWSRSVHHAADGKRAAIKRLRQVVRAAFQLSATYRQCLEGQNRA